MTGPVNPDVARRAPLSLYRGLPVVSGPAWPGVITFTTTRLRPQADTSPAGTEATSGAKAADFSLARAADRHALGQRVPGSLIWLNQVHGIRVVNEFDLVADQGIIHARPQADAIITARPGRAVAILTADCLPVVIGCSQGQVAGVAHAGWRGLAAGVLEATLAALIRVHPATNAGWRAWIGPSITQPAFEVGADVYDTFTASDAHCVHFFLPGRRPGKWLADLQGLARYRLYRAGVARVDVAGHCTWARSDWFYSYRRQPDTGRQATVLWLSAANQG